MTADVIAAVGTYSTKREVAEALGIGAGSIRQICENTSPELLRDWKDLPSDGVFVCSKAIPKPCRDQDRTDAIVAKAISDALAKKPFDKGIQRWTILRVLLSLFAVSRSLNFPNGWVRAALIQLKPHGVETTPSVMRWYRSQLASNPMQFQGVPELDPNLLARLAIQAYR